MNYSRALVGVNMAANGYKESQTLVSLIQAKYDAMPRSQKALAKVVLENPSLVCTCTTLELAAKVGVSNATVVRFASTLGFSGYAELQKISRQVLIADRYIRDDSISGGTLDAIVARQTQLVEYSFAHISQEDFDQLTDLIIGAKRIYVTGVRAVLPPAYFLARMLNLFFRNTLFLPELGESAYEELFKAGADDLFICVSLSRYSRYSFVLTELAVKRGIPVAAITDSLLAPVARIADMALIIGSEKMPMTSSVLGLTAVMEALLSALTARPGLSEIIRANLNTYEEGLSPRIFIG